MLGTAPAGAAHRNVVFRPEYPMIRRLVAVCLATLISVSPGALAAFDVADMDDDDRAAFRAEVRAYLLDNPEVIIEAITILEQQHAQAQSSSDADLVQRYSEALLHDGHSWIGGNPDGDVTLVEFVDYRCGFCMRAHPEVTRLLADDGNIRFVVKEFPILGPQSELAARYAIATLQTRGDDAYAQVHDALLTLRGDLTEQQLRRISDEVGLAHDTIQAHMDSAQVDAVIADNRRLAQSLDITGTPTFVLGDEIVRGFLPRADMQELVEAAREG